MQVVESMLRAQVRLDDLQVDPATSHLAAAGGKRLRPALVLLAAELGPHPEAQAVLDSAVVVELTHLASLYHDDVMDEAPMRRGVPSAQELFGNSVAILAGDILFARASIVVSGLGPRAVELHARTFERLCQGQLHETIGRRDGQSAREHYLAVLADKTGSLIAASARYGVLSAGGSEDMADVVAEYGERVGVAFQLADDVIDIVSDGQQTGKTPGTDLREGVDTMPIILLREQQAAGTLDALGLRILERLESADLTSDTALAEVVDMLRQHDVVAQTRQLAQQWVSDALTFLEDLPHDEVREALTAFARGTVERAA
ncbi:MAG: polyprenyl synthetase family protein [Actinomycetaceae bacterium]|nr:polyprenyl synthetase family protein [Actinomycetaceae bacterium]